MNPALRKMEYAVRGKVVIAADAIQLPSDDYPFDHIVYTNIGNPQSLGQAPLTWPRQVLALTDLPNEHGIDHADVLKLFPADAVRRAREIKAGLSKHEYGQSTGAYSHSKGVQCLRQDVAHFITQRDLGDGGDEHYSDVQDYSNAENIFLTNGASGAIQMVLTALIASPNDGVMIPIPQYPIYSATVDLLNGQKVGYYLDEAAAWELNLQELERAYQTAVDSGINVNSFVLINPGNPTGQVLSRENVHDIVKFCAKHRLVLLADEVYQENVYDENAEFVSCKRAAYETGLLQQDAIELISFHSVSKGVFGECGRRGGYMELTGIDSDVTDQLYKMASASLCATVTGQIMVSLMVRGPAVSDESYASHEAEKRAIFESLKRRSQLVSRGLDDIPGFSCQPAAGSMYCFPAIQMPQRAILAAQEEGESPDEMYCVSLLKRTGICVVPASGFGQKAGRFGFRTTFLPNEDEMARCVQLIRQHYQEFQQEYSS